MGTGCFGKLTIASVNLIGGLCWPIETFGWLINVGIVVVAAVEAAVVDGRVYFLFAAR